MSGAYWTSITLKMTWFDIIRQYFYLRCEHKQYTKAFITVLYKNVAILHRNVPQCGL